jgi:hypothetical protein
MMLKQLLWYMSILPQKTRFIGELMQCFETVLLLYNSVHMCVCVCVCERDSAYNSFAWILVTSSDFQSLNSGTEYHF